MKSNIIIGRVRVKSLDGRYSVQCCFSPEPICEDMPSSLDSAKRSLVSLLRELGQRYGIVVSVTRGSIPPEVSRAFRTVARRVHPDKPSGNKEDFQRLSAMHDAWTDLQKVRRPPGRPPQPRGAEARPALAAEGAAMVQVVPPAAMKNKAVFRLRARAVLLTYQGIDAEKADALKAWTRFLRFVQSNKRAWGVVHWTATMEANKDGGHHFHLMLDFLQNVDRTAPFFSFEGRCPNARANDLLGVGWSRSEQWQVSVNRGHFYVWVN